MLHLVMSAGPRFLPLAALVWGLALLIGGVGCREREDPMLARACASACNCKQQGLCGARDGHCAATQVEHCRSSNVCRLYGKCDAKEGRCVASSEEDCAQSAYCKDFGFCALSGSRCVKADAAK